MQTRRMGDSDLETSAIGFGCWEMGGTFGDFDDTDVINAIHRAIDLGVTLFDTAHVYGFNSDLDQPEGAGRSEELLGRALSSHRQDVLVVTKGGVPTRTGQNFPRDGRYPEVIRDCEESLRALQTDYIDLYLMHWPDSKVPIEEMMRALSDLLAAGKVRNVGVSNFRAAQLREARQYAPIIANQVGYNLFDRRWEREMFPAAAELGIGIMAYGPLAHGLLTGTLTLQTTFDQSDWRHKGMLFGQALFHPDHFGKNLAVVEQLKGIAAGKGISLPRLAIAWVLANPLVCVALTGARNAAEIEDNVDALDITLTDDERADLDTIMQGASGQVYDTLPT
jgi:aryl-alcohol dehydrogenase-like predicted oxidoreductase